MERGVGGEGRFWERLVRTDGQLTWAQEVIGSRLVGTESRRPESGMEKEMTTNWTVRSTV